MKVSDRKMHFNDVGKIAKQYWAEIANHFQFIELGNYVVMPNNMHGILISNKTISLPVQTRLIASVSNEPTPCGITGNKNPMIHENISRIIRSYKGRCTFGIHKMNPDFAWQSRFHDSIIRNAASFERVQNYIYDNPLNWKEDKFNIYLYKRD